MDEDAQRRAEKADRLAEHTQAQRRRSELESTKAQVLVDRFVEEASRSGLVAEELLARPWSGSGHYRTGIQGWYVRRDHSIGVSTDGGYYLLVVPPVRFGRWRTIHLSPTPPPLEVGRGARDGEAISLDALLERRLHWSESPQT